MSAPVKGTKNQARREYPLVLKIKEEIAMKLVKLNIKVSKALSTRNGAKLLGPRLKDSTLRHYAYELERRLDKVMARQPTNAHGIRLRKRYGKDRDSLFTFMTERGVPPTNNGSERDIRPSTIFRKVTNGFRSEWGSELYAGVRSTLNTGRRQGLSAFEAIQAAIDGQPLLGPG